MARGNILQTVIDIAGEISPTLGRSLDGVADKLEGVNLKAIAVGGAMTAAFAGVVTGVVKAGKYLADLGNEYNQAVNDISAATGAMGAELEGMGEVLKDVYSSGSWGDNMGDIAAGITEVHKATGLVDEALAETTKGAYMLSDVFGYDVAETARAAKAMMTNFGVDGYDAMNMIASGAQNGLDFSGELIDSISEYSVQFAKLGFSADDMFNVFQAGADSGAWNLDKVGDAVKEFSIRSIDGSKTTTHAFEALGYNAEEMMGTFAKGGKDASKAFKDVAKRLMKVDDAVERDMIGVELFGTQWEDLGIEAMTALSTMQEGAYATTDALAQIGEVKYDNLGDAFEAVKRKAEVSLLPLGTTIANALLEILPIIEEIFAEIGPELETLIKDLMPVLQQFLGAIMDILREIGPIIVDILKQLMPIIIELVQKILPVLMELIQAIVPPLMEIISAILPVIAELIAQILPIITKIVSMILPIIIELLNELLPIITPLLQLLLSIVEDVIMAILPPILQIVEAILPALIKIIGAIVKALSPVLKLLGPIAEVIGTIVGWIAKIVGWVADGLSWVIDIIFGGTDASAVSEAASANGFATGGFTSGVSIAGEDPRYPVEAVISFNPAYRAQNLAYWAKAGRMLGVDDADYYLSGGSGSSTRIDLGGVAFSPKIEIKGNANKDDVLEAIEEAYPDFLDMLEDYLLKRGAAVYG